MKRRRLGGIWFECLSPGAWISESRTIAAVHMMAGTTYDQWGLYLTQLGTGKVKQLPDDIDHTDFLYGDHMCSTFTLGELSGDIEILADWVLNLSQNLKHACERQDLHRLMGFGPPDPGKLDMFGRPTSPWIGK